MTNNIDISKLREIPDTEVQENTWYLIKIGIMNENGDTFYAIPDNFNPNEADEFAEWLDDEFKSHLKFLYRGYLKDFRSKLAIEPITFTGTRQEVIQAMKEKLKELKG